MAKVIKADLLNIKKQQEERMIMLKEQYKEEIGS